VLFAAKIFINNLNKLSRPGQSACRLPQLIYPRFAARLMAPKRQKINTSSLVAQDVLFAHPAAVKLSTRSP
jgi:hypothetical protein